jgi:hypothetical protein
VEEGIKQNNSALLRSIAYARPLGFGVPLFPSVHPLLRGSPALVPASISRSPPHSIVLYPSLYCKEFFIEVIVGVSFVTQGRSSSRGGQSANSFSCPSFFLPSHQVRFSRLHHNQKPRLTDSTSSLIAQVRTTIICCRRLLLWLNILLTKLLVSANIHEQAHRKPSLPTDQTTPLFCPIVDPSLLFSTLPITSTLVFSSCRFSIVWRCWSGSCKRKSSSLAFSGCPVQRVIASKFDVHHQLLRFFTPISRTSLQKS